ncbi:MAG: hypothetical protein WAT41_10525 [Flavobacteriales bacterium]
MNTKKAKDDYFWQLALAVNAAFKGLLASSGQSGHICAKTLSVCQTMDLSIGWEYLMQQIIEALPEDTSSGDVIVIPDKIVAISLKRIGPRSIILEPDPKTIDAVERSALAEIWSLKLGFQVDPKHLLLADEYGEDLVTLGVDNHNQRCYELASNIKKQLGLVVDVIISDTDTGLDVREPLIGTVTIAATPLGATNGVNIYEAMRCAVAAEFVRGHSRNIPIVICIPADRRRNRKGIGDSRTYSGMLDANRETFIAHA